MDCNTFNKFRSILLHDHLIILGLLPRNHGHYLSYTCSY